MRAVKEFVGGVVFMASLVVFVVVALNAGAGHETDRPITRDGILELGRCESDNDPHNMLGLGLFGGEHQWLPATWRSAAAGAGYPQWADTPVHEVPRDVQWAVTAFWWSSEDPAEQWPYCYDDALRAMGRHAPCAGKRNTTPCAEQPPIPQFAGNITLWRNN